MTAGLRLTLTSPMRVREVVPLARAGVLRCSSPRCQWKADFRSYLVGQPFGYGQRYHCGHHVPNGGPPVGEQRPKDLQSNTNLE